MKNRLKILAVFFCLSICVMSMQVNPVFASTIDGFRGLKWGDPPSEDLVFKKVYKDLSIYTRPNDKMSIGDIKLTAIKYIFWKNKFMGVDMNFEKASDYSNLEFILIGMFGRPDTRKVIQGKLYKKVWIGKTVICLMYQPDHGGVLSYRDFKLTTQWEMERIKKGVDDIKEDLQ